jgi:hypothetical protein
MIDSDIKKFAAPRLTPCLVTGFYNEGYVNGDGMYIPGKTKNTFVNAANSKIKIYPYYDQNATHHLRVSHRSHCLNMSGPCIINIKAPTLYLCYVYVT